MLVSKLDITQVILWLKCYLFVPKEMRINKMKQKRQIIVILGLCLILVLVSCIKENNNPFDQSLNTTVDVEWGCANKFFYIIEEDDGTYLWHHYNGTKGITSNNPTNGANCTYIDFYMNGFRYANMNYSNTSYQFSKGETK